jgi:hypothetical protein
VTPGSQTLEQQRLVTDWWDHAESSELFTAGGPQEPQAYAIMGVSYDHLCLQIAKDVRAVADGRTDSIKRFISTNTEDSRTRGKHWVPVVYEIVRDDEFDLEAQLAMALASPTEHLPDETIQHDEEASSSAASSANSQLNLGAILGSEDSPVVSSLWSAIRSSKWSLSVIQSTIALTIAFIACEIPQALARVLRAPHRYPDIPGFTAEELRHSRAVERAMINDRELYPFRRVK